MCLARASAGTVRSATTSGQPGKTAERLVEADCSSPISSRSCSMIRRRHFRYASTRLCSGNWSVENRDLLPAADPWALDRCSQFDLRGRPAINLKTDGLAAHWRSVAKKTRRASAIDAAFSPIGAGPGLAHSGAPQPASGRAAGRRAEMRQIGKACLGGDLGNLAFAPAWVAPRRDALSRRLSSK